MSTPRRNVRAARRPLRASAVAALLLAASALGADRHGVVDLDARLGALDPRRPIAYFELAEEVAYESSDESGADLARRLFVLAFELDRANPDGGALGPSVCLALAELATSPDERRWLLALGESLDTRSGARSNGAPARPSAPAATDARFLLAEALGRHRAGESSRALSALVERPEVVRLLDHHAGALGAASGAEVARRIQNAAPCRECQNKRIVRSGDARSPGRLCATCGGDPGPRLTDAELLAHLRVEAALLDAAHDSWAAQIVADGGAPLRDVDPAELAASFNVDSSRAYWRQGAWSNAPD